MKLNGVDAFILIVMGLSMITGLFRGFVKELIALVIWAIALWVAYSYMNALASHLQPMIHDGTVRSVSAFIILLLVTLILGAVINILLNLLIKRSGLGTMDRVLGMGFGFMRGIFILTVMMVVLNKTSIPEENYVHQSRLYAQFNPLVQWLSSKIPTLMQHFDALPQKEKSLQASFEDNIGEEISFLTPI